jgi:hypothetical protein
MVCWLGVGAMLPQTHQGGECVHAFATRRRQPKMAYHITAEINKRERERIRRGVRISLRWRRTLKNGSGNECIHHSCSWDVLALPLPAHTCLCLLKWPKGFTLAAYTPIMTKVLYRLARNCFPLKKHRSVSRSN